jgi:hypothetical protein
LRRPGDNAFSSPLLFEKICLTSFYLDLFNGFGGNFGDKKLVVDLFVEGVFLGFLVF